MVNPSAMTNRSFQIIRPRLNVATKLMRELAQRGRDVEREEHTKQQGQGDPPAAHQAAFCASTG
jgi:hypothetical protein